jgi:hypothetical protein
MIEPHKLVNHAKDVKEFPLQLTPETTLFFAVFLARGQIYLPILTLPKPVLLYVL